MCAVLNISPKTYYKYRSKEDLDYYDYLIIKEIFDENKRTYGYRRIVDSLLQKYGVMKETDLYKLCHNIWIM